MILNLFRRRPDPATDELYGAIVAQARHPAFYRDLGVPDTVEGRFEMLVAHVGLVTQALADPQHGSDAGVAERNRLLSERFFSDMDRTMREMGVGDLSVPKRMKKIAAAFYGRMEAYGRALAEGDDAGLTIAVERNVFAGEAQADAPAAIAAYMQEVHGRLKAQAITDILAGRPDFPPPGALRKDAS